MYESQRGCLFIFRVIPGKLGKASSEGNVIKKETGVFTIEE